MSHDKSKGDKLNYGHKKNCSRDNIEPNKLHISFDVEILHALDTIFVLTNGWQIIRSEIFSGKFSFLVMNEDLILITYFLVMNVLQ